MVETELSPPFSADSSPLSPENPKQSTYSRLLLPKVYHDRHNNVGRDPIDVVELDMDVARLNTIHRYLWLSGRPASARPLHRQKMIGREIVITEQADLHLVWHESRMFLKPLPSYMLDYKFWEDTICRRAALHASSCGFLLSYVWLLCYPSDLRFASELGLISSEIQWEDWTIFVDTFLSRVDHQNFSMVNKRYRYGELRLNRLNTIYRLTHICEPKQFVRGYLYGYNHYSVIFDRNFGWILLVFLYITTVLTAMQVGLATSQLEQNEMFQRASYGFSVFSIVLPIFIVGIALSLFLWLFIFNFTATLVFLKQERQRRRSMAA